MLGGERDQRAGGDEDERGEENEKADGGENRVVATGAHVLETDTRQAGRALPVSRATLDPLRWQGAASVRGRTRGRLTAAYDGSVLNGLVVHGSVTALFRAYTLRGRPVSACVRAPCES